MGKLDNYFNTIGLIGMNECCLNFLGKDITTKDGLSFTIEALNFMKATVGEYQRETGTLYNLEATPAEGASQSQTHLCTATQPQQPQGIW